jgi:putative membrane protein insertion efficiency factor
MTEPATRAAVGRRSPLLAAIRFYQRAISPALPARCRFYPTCSAYAGEAIERFGPARGTWLALRRLVKCAPWHPGGVDLVPGAVPARSRAGTPELGHSSSTAVPSATPVPDDTRRAHSATHPDPRRANEESSVA